MSFFVFFLSISNIHFNKLSSRFFLFRKNFVPLFQFPLIFEAGRIEVDVLEKTGVSRYCCWCWDRVLLRAGHKMDVLSRPTHPQLPTKIESPQEKYLKGGGHFISQSCLLITDPATPIATMNTCKTWDPCRIWLSSLAPTHTLRRTRVVAW